MDSCHIFNFLFGTRKATSELRKCFGVVTTRRNNRDKRYKSKTGSYAKIPAERTQPDDRIAPSGSAPLKRVQLKLAADDCQSVLSSSVSAHDEPDEGGNADGRQAGQQAASGIFEAQLVKLAHCDDENQHGDGGQVGQQFVERSHKLDCETSETDENNNNIRQPSKVIFENPANKLDNLHELAKELESSQKQTINVYDNPLASREPDGAKSGSSAEQLERARSGEEEANIIDEKKVKPAIDDKIRRAKSERIRNLVQSFEVNTRQQQQATTSTTSTTTTTTNTANNNDNKTDQLCLTPRRLQKPPETPPKSARAKCLNHQLSLRKPTSVASLFQSETFLVRHFFDKLAPIDRCAAAQVCRKWRSILYANPAYWSELTGVIDCTQLRREQLVECIMNTLQSAKLRHSHMREQMSASNGTTRPVQLASTAPISLNNQNNGNNNQQQVVADSQGHLFDLGQLDQDEIWRIQELCNRYTMRAFGNGLTSSALNHPPNQSQTNRSNLSSQQQHQQQQQQHDQSETTSATNQTTSGIANSKSSSSQISSSTLSSISISSLLSPLSESSRVDSIKERLYGTLEERGFVSICLFGATDDDIDELVSRTRPNGARRQLKLARLCNCALTDRGLETLASAFGQIEELELVGCNEITNGLDLRPLRRLRRLVITDCINIADGLAQRIVEVVHQLETLVVQAYHLTDAFLEFIALGGDTSQLRRLELPNCKEITNATALTIAKHFQSLETLSISGSTKIDDDGVELLAEHMKSLISLDLGWLKIGDLSLECLACDLRHLRELILDRNVHITDLGLSYLATMANLSLLYVRWCPQLTDKSIASISNMRSLTNLSLAGLHQVTARGILSLLDSQQLEELELTNCPAVTSELQQFLSAKLPHCNIIC